MTSINQPSGLGWKVGLQLGCNVYVVYGWLINERDVITTTFFLYECIDFNLTQTQITLLLSVISQRKP